MKKLQILLLVLCALVFAACSSKKSDTPTGIVTEYLDCIKAGNYDNAVKCFHFEKEAKEAELKALAAKLEEGYTKDGKLLKYEIVSEEITKDDEGNDVKGKVEVKLFYENDKEDEQTIKTVKDNGKWKIEFSIKG